MYFLDVDDESDGDETNMDDNAENEDNALEKR